MIFNDSYSDCSVVFMTNIIYHVILQYVISLGYAILPIEMLWLCCFSHNIVCSNILFLLSCQSLNKVHIDDIVKSIQHANIYIIQFTEFISFLYFVKFRTIYFF